MQFDLMRETAIRWSDPDPRHVPLLREGGITAVVAAREEGFEKACLAAGIRVISEEQVQTLGLHEVGKARPGVTALVKAGLWPGVRGRDPSIASATRSIWIDQNCHLIGYLRALHPGQPALLGYLPDSDAGVREGRVIRFESLELALTEAWVAGGNYVMSLGTRLRDALLKGAPDALAAWRRLGRTAQWLRDNTALFRQPVLPIVTVLVDENESALEIANLSYRNNVSPAIEAATNPPAADPRRRLVLVAAGIDAPKGETRRRILAHAQAGAIVVADEPGDRGLVASARAESRSQRSRPPVFLGRKRASGILQGAGHRSGRIGTRPHRHCRSEAASSESLELPGRGRAGDVRAEGGSGHWGGCTSRHQLRPAGGPAGVGAHSGELHSGHAAPAGRASHSE